MKKRKLLRAMSLADDKYVEEAAPRNLTRRPAWHKWTAIAACLCLLVTALNLVLFIPYNTNPPDVSEYEGSEYYSVIQSINALTYQKPKYKNNFQSLMATLSSIGKAFDNAVGGMPMAPGDGENSATGEDINQKYEEVTDNQVAGVIEGDIFKRSDKYIYYMVVNNLYVYSIEKEDSKLVYSCSLDRNENVDSYTYYSDGAEMYLSADCATLTVIMPMLGVDDNGYYTRMRVEIVSLDVSDPANTRETNRVTVTGKYLSSRVVDGQLMVMTNMLVQNPDFSDESTFLPQIDSGNGFESIAPENIVLPGTLSSPRYTSVFLLDEKTLAPLGDAAFLSYSQEVYVSTDSIYATSQYTDRTQLEDGYTKTEVMTEIARLSYAGGTLTPMGKTTVSGRIKDQYSLDEYEGILRVVTTTSTSKFKEVVTGNNASISIPNDSGAFGTNASLYCIDVNTWETVAKVENFAPWGETVESVRFDGDKAYVCTAVVVTLGDPVFFFDLSDLNNITVKDTGEIDGYSWSLVNFGNGYLLGVGVNGAWELKIEIYEESEDGIVSVTAYEKRVDCALDYKAYFIDRKNQLIGLALAFL